MYASVIPLRENPGLTARLRGAEARLRRSAYFAIRDVRCELSGGQVRLVGRVPSYYLKQVAQAIVAEVMDEIVSNQIEVVASPDRQPVGGDRTARRETASHVRLEPTTVSHPLMHS